jgi:uncharacterized coiled-coil protein SlyX
MGGACDAQLQALKQAMRSLAEEKDAAADAKIGPLNSRVAEQQRHIADLTQALEAAQKVILDTTHAHIRCKAESARGDE